MLGACGTSLIYFNVHLLKDPQSAAFDVTGIDDCVNIHVFLFFFFVSHSFRLLRMAGQSKFMITRITSNFNLTLHAHTLKESDWCFE